ncbi:MAG: prolyl oligopeptidase family serine peptidase [Bacteroidota bacterium]
MYANIVLIAILISLLPATINAQFTLVDRDTEQAVVGSFYQTANQQYGTTDELGRFTLRLASDTVRGKFSHLAYRDTIFAITASQDTYYLNPLARQLPEIKVSSRKARKVRSPRQLLRQSLKSIKNNYPTNRQSRAAVYRELLRRNGDLVQLNEALVEVEISPYGEKHRHRKAWSVGWTRNVFRPHRLNGGFRYLGVHFPEGTQQYAALNDRYRVIDSRISIGPEPDNYYHRLAGGPLGLVWLDKVRLGYDYLDPKGLKDYVYQLVDTVTVNGAFCYHLRFEPAKPGPTKYFALSKTHATGVFSGDLFLTLADLSIVRFTATNAKTIVANYGDPPKVYLQPGFVNTVVNYARTPSGRWQLSTVVAATRSLVDTALVATRVLSFAGDKMKAVDSLNKSNWVFQDYSTTLRNLSYAYHVDFWRAFSQSTFYRTAEELTGSREETASFSEDYFAAPFRFDTVLVPRAIPSKGHKYVNPKRIKDKFAWLADPKDSATTTYLNWENDYYAQFFRRHPVLYDSISVQFAGSVQGWSGPEPPRFGGIDTVLTTKGGNWGFYRVGAEIDTTLLRPTNPPSLGYLVTDYGWTTNKKWFYVLTANRAYDQKIRVYGADGRIAERAAVDDYRWRGDTLYVTENNAQLRTALFSRWTAIGDWETLLQEADPTFEYRLKTLPAGDLILIRESLTEANIFRESSGKWAQASATYPALLAGSGEDGTGCMASISADYLADCRETIHGTCVLAVDSARQEIWLNATGSTDWRRIPLPPGQQYATFDRTVSAHEIVLKTEGVGTYGKQYRIDFASRRLVPISTERPPIDLPGYRDSIVWVPTTDGTSVPCQLRWKMAEQNALKNTVLKVYAAYGNPYLVGHNEVDIALMNLGCAVVYVHARGGGMRGPAWHDAGRAANKQNACTDYLAAARYFADRHPLTPTPLSGYAQSAGGPVLGYAVNMVPELFQAAVFDHAYLDVIGTMSRPELPLTQYEYPEWGDPADKKILAAQRSYSPYQNVREQTYPAMLFLAGRYDQSTPYWQIAKYVAAVREAQQGEAPIVLHTAMRGSHPGTPFGPGLDKLVEQIVFLLANQ